MRLLPWPSESYPPNSVDAFSELRLFPFPGTSVNKAQRGRDGTLRSSTLVEFCDETYPDLTKLRTTRRCARKCLRRCAATRAALEPETSP
jgi:hypothetical protein